MDANKPINPDGTTYHLQTREDSIAKNCLLVGNPERATMIAETLFTNPKLVGNHRGLKSYTGEANGKPISVVTTGMGGPSIGIVLPEAHYSGARRFIRVGSCGGLWSEVEPGDLAICTGAVRFDGTSSDWAPIEYPALANHNVVSALEKAAQDFPKVHHTGIGATTACFVSGQARPDMNGYISQRMQMRHDELVQGNVLFYSMEEATLFIWCLTQRRDIWAGSVDAIFANRHTGKFEVIGEEEAALVAIRAFHLLNIQFPL